MAARPGVVPVVGMTDRELELRRAEQETGAMEAQLSSEIVRLEDGAAELVSRLQHLKASVSHLQLQGARDNGFAELLERIQGLSIPALDISPQRERALQVRIQAVNARSDCAAAIRTSVDGFSAELTVLTSRLGAEEAAVQRARKLLEAEIERRANEAQATEAQRRADEAQRAAVGPTPLLRQRKTTDLELPIRGEEPISARKRPRVKMQAVIDLSSDSNFYTGFSTNISEGGIFVATVNTPPRGARVELHFSLPNGKKLDVRGQVRWSREVNDKTPDIFPGVGVQFVDLAPDVQTEIRQFVAEREPMFFPD